MQNIWRMIHRYVENILQRGERGAERELQMPEKHVPFVVEKACHRIFGMIIEKMLELAGKI